MAIGRDAPAGEALSRSDTLVRRSAADAGGSFAATLAIGLISSIVIARLYGVSVIGEFALVAAPWTMLVQLSSVGEQLALIRSVASEPPRSIRTTSVFVVVVCFSSVLTLGVALVVTPVSVLLMHYAAGRPNLVAPAVVLIVAYVAVENLSWNADRLLIAVHRARPTFAVRIGQLLVLLGSSIVLAAPGTPDVWDLTWATVAAGVFGLLTRIPLVAGQLAWRPARRDLLAAVSELPSFIRFGLRLMPGGLAGGLTAPAAAWLIGATRPIGVLGGYSRAAGLASRLQEGSYRINDVLLPTLARLCNAGHHVAAAKEFSRLRTFVAVCLAGGAAAIAGSATGLLSVFGPDFSRASGALALLVFAYAAGLLAVMHHMLFLALDQPAITSKLALVRTVVTLSTLVPLVLAFGATGAGAAFLAGFGVELVVAQRWTDRHLAALGAALVPVPWLRLAIASGAALVAAAVTDAVLASVAGGVAGAFVGLAVFTLIALALGLLPGPARRPARRGHGARAAISEGTAQADDAPPPPRVLYIVSRFPKVTETFVYEEIAALNRLGFDTPILALVEMHEDVVQPRAVDLAPSVRVGARSPLWLVRAQLWWLRRHPQRLARLWSRVLRSNRSSLGELTKAIAATLVASSWARDLADDRPPHVHAHFATWGAHCAYVVGALLEVPYSFTAHAHDVFGENGMLEEKLRGASFVVVISEFERRLLERRFPASATKLRLVHCGIDLRSFVPSHGRSEPTGPVQLLCIAGLADYKGHPVLFDACARLRRSGVDVACTLVGDGPERAGLEALARRLGLEGVVHFAGRQPAPEVRRLLGQADVVVQPSVVAPAGHMDGIPVAIMEALASCRPVVASALSGIPELVEDGVTGLLVPPADPGALAGAIERLLGDADLRADLAVAGRRRVERDFDIAHSARQLSCLFLRHPDPEVEEGLLATGAGPIGPT